MIGHSGLLRAFSFTRPIRGSGHVQEIYPQTCPDGRRLAAVLRQMERDLLTDVSVIPDQIQMRSNLWRPGFHSDVSIISYFTTHFGDSLQTKIHIVSIML